MSLVNEREFAFAERDFKRVCDLIRTRAGISLNPSKKDMVYSRLARRLRALGIDSFTEYLDRLERHGGDEWQAFTNALTTNLTSFFREGHHFDVLKKHLLRQPQGSRLQIWTCAASTGEEPYSIAIAACEAFNTLTPPVDILATDLDTNVLETAARGVYGIDRIEKVDPARQKKFFRRGTGPNEGLCRVIPELQKLLTFQPLNLLDADYGLRGPYCAIFCRNVMIYFEKPTQYEIIARIKPLLAMDGLFFAGHSESFFHATDLIRNLGRTVYARSDSKVGLP